MPYDSTVGSKPGMEIWRVENMDVQPVDPSSHGSFFSGDCYIILQTNKKMNRFEFDLFYWQGKNSSQDEKGVSAYKTVELDDMLGGKPVQHREVQDHESPLFMSYFPKGIKYLDGGIDSAFRHVDRDAYIHRLFHIKGKRNVRCQQVELSAKLLNDGDVFILDTGLIIYQWNGKEANKYEKFKGLEIATKIKDSERGGKAKLVFLDSGKTDDADFWKHLNGSSSDVQSASTGGDDDSIRAAEAVLVRVSDASGSMEITEVARGARLDKNSLDHSDVFILDTGAEVFVWVPKGATAAERAKGMEFGAEYLKKNDRPAWTPLTRIPAGGETPVFKSLFKQWDVEPASNSAAVSSAPKEKKLEMDALFSKQKEAEEKMIDDATGKIEIWRIENLKKVPVEPSTYGQFYSGDSYILLYSYKQNGKDAFIIYFWQGRDSSQDEKATSAFLAVEMDQSLGNSPVQVRVVQGKEPNHFLSLFKGKFIVHEGGVESGFKNRASGSSETSEDGVRLYHIRGTTPINTRAVQISASSSSLNSGDCFVAVLSQKNIAYVWLGKGSNEEERKFAQNISQSLHSSASVIEEGSEPEEFWTALGGKTEYASSNDLGVSVGEPRLFLVSGVTVSGNYRCEEIFNFTQDDLQQDNVYLLDTINEVYIWIGNECKKDEKDAAMKIALFYVENATDGRSKETPVFKVGAGVEPVVFTAHFLGWDYKKASDFSDPYLAKLAQMKISDDSSSSSASGSSAPVAAARPTVERVTSDMIGYSTTAKYTLAELKAGTPSGVHPAKKENYLNDAEFETTFKMSRDAFEKLAQWKKDDAKKKAGIF